MIPGPNWARRYVTPQRRLCARPGCGTAAAATLRFQPTQREAWLVDLDVAGSRTEGDLCARHAATLVLPRGWQLHDQRTPAGGAVTAPATAPTRRDDEPRPGLAAVPDTLSAPELEDLADTLDAQTPLLRRAFQNVWPVDDELDDEPGDDADDEGPA